MLMPWSEKKKKKKAWEHLYLLFKMSGTMNSHDMLIRNTLTHITNHLNIRNDRFTEFYDITTELIHSSTPSPAKQFYIEVLPYISDLIGSRSFVTSHTELIHSPAENNQLYIDVRQLGRDGSVTSQKCSFIARPPNLFYVEALCLAYDCSYITTPTIQRYSI